ncbi:hypothetical protein FK514_28145, partial [Klebsiella pneumoniae]|nr:hypothetical protein [Klebsiella pneumoniae]
VPSTISSSPPTGTPWAIRPIVGMLQGVVEKGGELRVEVADTNESKELMKFCRKFTVPLRAALREAGVLTNYETPKRPVVHVFFIAPSEDRLGEYE